MKRKDNVESERNNEEENESVKKKKWKISKKRNIWKWREKNDAEGIIERRQWWNEEKKMWRNEERKGEESYRNEIFSEREGERKRNEEIEKMKKDRNKSIYRK